MAAALSKLGPHPASRKGLRIPIFLADAVLILASMLRQDKQASPSESADQSPPKRKLKKRVEEAAWTIGPDPGYAPVSDLSERYAVIK